MKAILLNGALPGDKDTDVAGQMIATDLERRGWQVMTLTLRDMHIAYCLGCFYCWTHTPGLCRIKDEGIAVAEQIIHSDLLVLLTRVTFGGYSSELKKTLDRNICLISPFFKEINGEIHHRQRYDRFPSMLGIGIMSQDHSAQAATFTRLVQRNAINFHAPVQDAYTIQAGIDSAAITSTLNTFFEQSMVTA